jgi:hypothetical protein
MKRRTSFFYMFMLCILSAWRTVPDVTAGSEDKDGRQLYRFHIMWGIKTKTKQIWDGHAEVDAGEILEVLPFQRNEKPDESMLVSETSWRSTTYLDVEGIYLVVRAPKETKVSIYTKTCNFTFSVSELKPGETKQELDGDIEIRNDSEEILFRIAGLEKGIPGKGTATIMPTIARANTLGTWTVTYTAPEGGLPVGGGIRISWHFTRSWGEPQFSDPQSKNYVTARTTGKSRLDYTSEHLGLFEYPFNLGRILVRIFDEPLREGEKIIVTLGDTSHGSPGFEAPVVSEKKCSIRVEDCTEVPEAGFPVYRRLKELPWVEVLPSKPHRFFVVAPSLVQADLPFDVRMVVEDVFRNVVVDFEGKLQVLVDAEAVRQVNIGQDDAGMLTIPEIVIKKPGAHWITVREVGGNVSGESNPIKCVAEAPANRLVWGELHGHTEYSDGYGTPDDYFGFARKRAILDFAAITDHDTELDAPDYHVEEMWREVNAAVKRHNDPPVFCTIPAYEWSPARRTISTIAPYGDHNVYYEHEDMPIFKARDPNANTVSRLYKDLNAITDCVVRVIPHVGGAITNWEYHNPELESLAEIYSVHGGFEEFGKIALQKGYVVGFVGASDSHCGQIGGFPPGNVAGHYTHGGLTAAYVPELSRPALFSAFKSRSVYATSGERVILNFSINGLPMGTVIETESSPLIRAEVIGTAPLLLAEVVKNGKVIYTWQNEYEGEDSLILLWGNRVEQADLQDFDESLWSYYLRHVNWSGGLKAIPGRIAFQHTCSFDYPQDRILEQSESEIGWTSETRGDWDGVVIQLPQPQIKLELSLGDYHETIDFAALEHGLNSRELGESDQLLIAKGKPQKRAADFTLKDRTILYESNYYYLRVLQANGEMAWSSPIWIKKQ